MEADSSRDRSNAQMPSVLIVEDDDEVRGLLVSKLARAGFPVRALADGEAAVQLAEQVHPDVILLDWMMPRVTGPEVCRRLRRREELAETRVIMLTSKADEIDVQRGFAAGADDYMIKPVSPRELISRLQAAMEIERPE
jgi:two-component system, OmpR family, phosphate regulon response regulator PhoB